MFSIDESTYIYQEEGSNIESIFQYWDMVGGYD